MHDWKAEVEQSVKKEEAEWKVQADEASAAGKDEPSCPRLIRNRPVDPTSPDGGFSSPGNLFNGMIAPLIPFSIKGVIWYQGESNGDNRTDAVEYATLFPLLIKDWRAHWNL